MPCPPHPRCSALKFLLDERIGELGLVSINPSGGIVYCNATFEVMLGMEAGAAGFGGAGAERAVTWEQQSNCNGNGSHLNICIVGSVLTARLLLPL